MAERPRSMRLRTWRRDLIWKLRRRGRYYRPMGLDETTQEEKDAAIARGRELAKKYGWVTLRPKGKS